MISSAYADVCRVTLLSGLKLHVEASGKESSETPILCIHGLGGSSANYSPIIDASGVANHRLIITFDLEGHGLSPYSGGTISIEGFVDSAAHVLETLKINKAIVVGHSMAGLIATTLAVKYPTKVEKLILIGPVKSLGEVGIKGLTARASRVREGGMSAVADTVATAGVSQKTLTSRPLSKGAVRASLLSTPPEGYALACLALTRGVDPDYTSINAPTLILAGTEDKTSPEATIKFLSAKIPNTQVVTLQDIGHWHLLEDVESVGKELAAFV